MGLRYENDEFKPTNGPVIYFTGLTNDSPLVLAINSAVNKRLSFYSYRLPYEINATFGSSENFETGLSKPGFIIAYFDPGIPFINIPFSYCKKQNFEFSKKYEFPCHSTSKEEYENEVLEILKIIGDSDKDKIVASRVLNIKGNFNIGNIFEKLCNRYRDAFIYCFSTPETGCWIGASPELLLEAKEYKFFTMALAGTMGREDSLDWDDKNLKEQSIVTEYILEVFSEAGMNAKASEPFTISAGDVKHICSLIEASSPEWFDEEYLSGFLKKLSPTPALCGFPKKRAMDFIHSNESFPRALYGGFCGPYFDKGNFRFNVNIRCGAFSDKSASLYAGGGIRKGSKPSLEWNETEKKLKTLLNIIE